ncbi:MAG: endo-1,4-beta-xylanase [Candidatus Tyrphobacter sp.]
MVPLLGGTVRAATDEGLAAAAARGRRFFGAAARIDRLNGEGDLREAVLRECSCLVPEVDLNWNAVEPAYGQYAFEKIDGLAEFAAMNRMLLRGHTLLWHLSVPEWATVALRERRDWGIIATHFDSVVPRYAGVIDRWEVVNEAIDVGDRADGLRESIFLEAFGPEYVGRAFHEARRLAPQSQLIVNEYGLEYDLPEERDRRYLFLQLLERLKNAGAPIDGVGVQAHLDLRKGHIATASIAAFLREVAAMGLSIAVTELDVKEADYIAPMETRDRLVADEVRRYLDVVLAQQGITGVTTWGLSDRHSWLEVIAADYARFPGAWTHGDGPGLNRGLPLDSSMRRKPMYYAIRDALSA